MLKGPSFMSKKDPSGYPGDQVMQRHLVRLFASFASNAFYRSGEAGAILRAGIEYPRLPRASATMVRRLREQRKMSRTQDATLTAGGTVPAA